MNNFVLDDQSIRCALKKHLSKQHVPIIVEEFELLSGHTRADLFIYNNFFTGIEIKSEKDTLIRLPRQVEIYNQYFEKIEIIVANSHLHKVEELLPKWWGITSVVGGKKNLSFKIERQSRLNPLFKSDLLLEFLWKDEMIELLTMYGYTKGIKSQCRYELRSFAKDLISYDELKFFVSDFMKKRTNWRSVEQQKLSDD